MLNKVQYISQVLQKGPYISYEVVKYWWDEEEAHVSNITDMYTILEALQDKEKKDCDAKE